MRTVNGKQVYRNEPCGDDEETCLPAPYITLNTKSQRDAWVAKGHSHECDEATRPGSAARLPRPDAGCSPKDLKRSQAVPKRSRDSPQTVRDSPPNGAGTPLPAF